MNDEKQQTLALIATIQSLYLVHQVASKGIFDSDNARPVLHALVTYNPDDTLSALGGDIQALALGKSQLTKMLHDEISRDIAQYLLAIIVIELKLVCSQPMRSLLQSELQRIAHLVVTETAPGDDDDELFERQPLIGKQLTSDEILGEFATVYKQTASQTEPRVMIKGNHEYLKQEHSANQIRALLLAALRGVSFFRHYGGKRFDLMIKRGQYLQLLETL